MKRKYPTILVLLVMVLVGAMYWIDLSYYTNLATGFPVAGGVWMRYAVLLLPLAMAFLGSHTIGPRGISVLRVRNHALAGLFAAAALVGAAYGVTSLVVAIQAATAWHIVWSLLYIWYGIWMFLASMQLWVQAAVTPTKSVLAGILACIPLCALSVWRVMLTPASIMRPGPTISCLTALFCMLWMGLLLRALYIALPRQRVRWIYFMGVLTFLLATCLDFPATLHSYLFRHGGASFMDVFESFNLAMLGLCAGCVSASLAGKSDAPVDSAALVSTWEK